MLNPIGAFIIGLACGFSVTYSVAMNRLDVLWLTAPFLLTGVFCWAWVAMRQARRETDE